jgi:homogentisate phytyltransferase/homogentisate geranylgeranyltransferase
MFSNFYDFYTYFNTNSFFVDLPIFFISCIISIIILLHIFTKEKIIKIFKIIIPFYSIILLPPVIDILFSGYKGVYYQYVLNINDYIDFLKFGLIPFMKTPALTAGLKTELFIIVFFSMIYVFAKSKKYYKSILCGVSIFLLFSFYVAAPVWRDNVFNIIRMSISNVFFFLTAIQLVLILIFEYKKKLVYFLKDVRPVVLGHFLIMLLLGLMISYDRNISVIKLNWFYLIFLCLSVCFGWFFAVSLNDIFDLKIDKITKKSRVLVKDKMNISDYNLIVIISFIISILFAAIVSYEHFIFILVYDCIGFIYSVPPLRLKKYPIISTSLIALASLISTYMGFSLVTGIKYFPLEIASLLLITITIAFNVKDIEDIEGDRKNKIWTIPVILGEKRSRNVIGCLIFISYILIPVILNHLNLLILSIIWGIINFLIIRMKRGSNSTLLLLYFVYLFLFLLLK